MLDGTERLGALRLTLPDGTDPRDKVLRGNCWTLAGQIAHLVLSKQLYSDLFHRVRRGKPLSVAAELLWQLLPPKVFATDRVVIAAAMEPYDEVGGDGFDYAVDGDRASVAIFDSVGHDLHAGLITSMALAATRNARRGGADLIEAAELADHTIMRPPPGRLDVVRDGVPRPPGPGHRRAALPQRRAPAMRPCCATGGWCGCWTP